MDSTQSLKTPADSFKLANSGKVGIVGVSINEGQDLGGPELAPDALRAANLLRALKELGWNCEDVGNIDNQSLKMVDTGKTDENKTYKYDIKHSDILGATCKKLHDTTKAVSAQKNFSLVLGGDHGLATGSISGMLETYPDLKVIWVDAHGDINVPETSPSGNYHGMPVAHLIGLIAEGTIEGFDWYTPKLKPENIVFIGLRDIDAEERKIIKKTGVKYFDMHMIDKHGIGEIMEQTLKYLKVEDGSETPLYISFDVDGVDPAFAPATGTRARGGLNYREGMYICRRAAESGCLVGFEMVEINPLLEPKKNYREILHGDSKIIKGTETVCLGVELIIAAMGHTLV